MCTFNTNNEAINDVVQTIENADVQKIGILKSSVLILFKIYVEELICCSTSLIASLFVLNVHIQLPQFNCFEECALNGHVTVVYILLCRFDTVGKINCKMVNC